MDEESKFLNTVNIVCVTNINICQDIIETSGRLGYSSSVIEKANECIDKMESVKRQFLEVVDETKTSNQSSNRLFDEEKFERTMEFITIFNRQEYDWRSSYQLILEKPELIHYKNPRLLRKLS